MSGDGFMDTQDILEYFEFLYETYYLEDDENLGKYGLEIKREIADILEGSSDER